MIDFILRTFFEKIPENSKRKHLTILTDKRNLKNFTDINNNIDDYKIKRHNYYMGIKNGYQKQIISVSSVKYFKNNSGYYKK